MKKFRTTYACKVTKIHGSDLDKYISLAGLEKLKPLMPANIDLSKNEDLLAVVLNAAVGNYANKNGDAITNEASVTIAPNFVWKYVNLNHDRSKCVGVICNYGFSQFGDNTLIPAEEAAKSKDPINLSLAVLLWKPTISEKLLGLLEASADESDDLYGAVSASWELFFDDYDIAVGESKDLSKCEIITGLEKAKYESALRLNGGTGEIDGKYVYAVLKHENNGLIPAGIGLVHKPAAEVEGLAIVAEENKIESNANIIKTPEENSVTNHISCMKYKFLEKLTEASTQESIAGDIDNLIADRLREAETQYKASLEAKQNEQANLEAKNKELAAAHETLQKEFSELKSKVEAKEKEDLYNSRMDYFNQKFDLSDAHRTILASRLKDLDEAGYQKLQSEMDVLLAAVSKKEKKESTASVDQGEIKTAVTTAEKTQTPLPNSQTPATSPRQSMRELAQKAFNKESITINF